MEEQYQVSVLRVRDDVGPEACYVGLLYVEEIDGLMLSVTLEADDFDLRDYLEEICDAFDPENCPLIWRYKRKGRFVSGAFVNGEEVEFEEDDIETPREQEVLGFLERAARRLIQRARLGQPILVVPYDMDSHHWLFSRAKSAFDCDAARLTEAPAAKKARRPRKKGV